MLNSSNKETKFAGWPSVVVTALLLFCSVGHAVNQSHGRNKSRSTCSAIVFPHQANTLQVHKKRLRPGADTILNGAETVIDRFILSRGLVEKLKYVASTEYGEALSPDSRQVRAVDLLAKYAEFYIVARSGLKTLIESLSQRATEVKNVATSKFSSGEISQPEYAALMDSAQRLEVLSGYAEQKWQKFDGLKNPSGPNRQPGQRFYLRH